ncbi:MAG: hypothetical protein GX354_08195 [Firmicutes bacterium]|nr:hypothetical protein [Bacillota bacterium]
MPIGCLDSDPNDPIVKMIKIHMLEADRRLVDGQPPLTEAVATAYGELLAYAELLGRDGSATPKMIEHRESARNMIVKLAPEEMQQSSLDTDSTVMAMVRHQKVLQIQQQTFNHYMWCMGYHKTIYGF